MTAIRLTEQRAALREIAILGSRGWIEPERVQETSELLRISGQNTGNLVFQHAVRLLVNGELRPVGAAGKGYGDKHALDGVSHLIFPAANLLQPGLDLMPLAGFLRRCPVPLIVLGLGAQADAAAPDDEAIAGIVADEAVRALASALRERAAFVSVRGAFSAKVCAALGLEDVEVLGCPSLLINPYQELGQEIARGLMLVKHKADHDLLRVGVSAAAPFEAYQKPPMMDVERRLFAWAREHDGLYVQQSGGLDVMEFARGNVDKVAPEALLAMRQVISPDMSEEEFVTFSRSRQRVFSDARAWGDELFSYDLMLGTRMHGNMIALGVGVPTVHVVHDSRTAELVETMRLPHVSTTDVLECETVGELLERVSFNAVAFDENRRRVASRYVERLGALGLVVSAPARTLAA